MNKKHLNQKNGADTGYWYEKVKDNSLNEYVTIPDGEKVTYTGIYKTTTNALTKEVFIYVQVERMNHDKEKVYVRATNLMKKAQEEHEADESETISKLSKATISSRVNETRKTAGKEGETYTIAIAAGHNNTNDTGARKGILKEEELTIKTAETS